MLNILKNISTVWNNYQKGKEAERNFFDGFKLVYLSIGKILHDEYTSKMDTWTADVLSAQVTNYLTGTSIKEVMEESNSELKVKIKELFETIPNKALEVMEKKPRIKMLVLDTLFFKDIIDRAHFSKDRYLNLPERKQVDAFLNHFDSENFSTNLDSNVYLESAKSFFKEVFPNDDVDVVIKQLRKSK